MKSLIQHIFEQLSIRKAISNIENLGDTEFEYDNEVKMFLNGSDFIHDYYLKRVKIDGYKKLENNDNIDVFFVGRTIYRQYKGKLTRYIMTHVKDGETFEEVYNRIIDNLKDHNISLLE